MRTLIRLSILALAAYGTKALYDQFSPKVRQLRGPASEFIDRTSKVVDDTAGRTRDAARQAVSAVSDAADELQRAADDATDEATRRLSDTSDASELPAQQV
jgi:hypothetical protein